MTKSLFRTVWIFLILSLIATAFIFFQKGKALQQKIYRKNASIVRLKVEKNKMAETKKLLNELDQKTISEVGTTQLGILRHLGLEQDGYILRVLSKQENQVGDVALSVRSVQIETQLPYSETMALVDKMQRTGKINLTKIAIKRPSGYGESVDLILDGIMYGLNKNE